MALERGLVNRVTETTLTFQGEAGVMESVFTPTWASHFCTAVAINSLPLSDLMFAGGPRAMNSSANAARTSS